MIVLTRPNHEDRVIAVALTHKVPPGMKSKLATEYGIWSESDSPDGLKNSFVCLSRISVPASATRPCRAHRDFFLTTEKLKQLWEDSVVLPANKKLPVEFQPGPNHGESTYIVTKTRKRVSRKYPFAKSSKPSRSSRGG
jgi:hypothetical protein